MRLHPDIVLTKLSPNYSSRDGARIKLIVLHSTESKNYKGTNDLAGVASWFANRASEVSSHVVVDDDGTSARIVPDALKAWHCAAFNAPSLGIEQIGFASQGNWSNAELDETARWLAHWSRKYGIPLRRGRVIGSTVVRRGVVTHKQLGLAGGGHVDPGSNYPVKHVIRRAREIKSQL